MVVRLRFHGRRSPTHFMGWDLPPEQIVLKSHSDKPVDPVIQSRRVCGKQIISLILSDYLFIDQ
jgi:hypothetical protein